MERWLESTYVQLVQTEDGFLYARGVPYFSWFLNAAVTAYRGSNTQRDGITWLTSFAAKVDPPGREKVNRAIRLLSESKTGSSR